MSLEPQCLKKKKKCDCELNYKRARDFRTLRWAPICTVYSVNIFIHSSWTEPIRGNSHIAYTVFSEILAISIKVKSP